MYAAATCRDCCCSHVYAYLLPDTEHHLRELCHDILFGELRDFLRPNGIDQKCRVLVLFIVVLAVVSLNVFKGANIVEEYVLLSALLHIIVV